MPIHYIPPPGLTSMAVNAEVVQNIRERLRTDINYSVSTAVTELETQLKSEEGAVAMLISWGYAVRPEDAQTQEGKDIAGGGVTDANLATMVDNFNNSIFGAGVIDKTPVATTGTTGTTGTTRPLTPTEALEAQEIAAELPLGQQFEQFLSGQGPQAGPQVRAALERQRKTLTAAFLAQQAATAAGQPDEAFTEFGQAGQPGTFLSFLRGARGSAGDVLRGALPALRQAFSTASPTVGQETAASQAEANANAIIQGLTQTAFAPGLRGAVQDVTQQRLNSLLAAQAAQAAGGGSDTPLGTFESFLSGGLPSAPISATFTPGVAAAFRADDPTLGQATAREFFEPNAAGIIEQALGSRFAPALQGAFSRALANRFTRFEEQFPTRSLFGEFVNRGFTF